MISKISKWKNSTPRISCSEKADAAAESAEAGALPQEDPPRRIKARIKHGDPKGIRTVKEKETKRIRAAAAARGNPARRIRADRAETLARCSGKKAADADVDHKMFLVLRKCL